MIGKALFISGELRRRRMTFIFLYIMNINNGKRLNWLGPVLTAHHKEDCVVKVQGQK
jgi:hypothetical protein